MDYFLFNFSGVQFHYTMSPADKNLTPAEKFLQGYFVYMLFYALAAFKVLSNRMYKTPAASSLNLKILSVPSV